MRIISWNCNGAFRKKFQKLDELEADILVIQECEDPAQCTDLKYQNWARNYLWKGDSKHKGIGIFCNNNHSISNNDWQDDGTKHFISARINNQFNLVAVWAHRGDSHTFDYIGQFWKYLQINKPLMKDTFIMGDFNSNKIWDKKHREWNHSHVVRELGEIGIESLYHNFQNEEQGKESMPTLFLQKKLEKPYHIDYAFADKRCFPNIHNFKVGERNEWLAHSDHMPIIVDF